ncbi:MAG: hypothetical protein IKT30_06300 [Bacteroidaceae bacterium]|nr:hypothetical protein [Bacteroidaceae bacterium]
MSKKSKEENLTDLLEGVTTALRSGNSHLTDSQCETALDALHTVLSPDVSKYDAMRIMDVKRTRYDELVKEGEAPKGEHRIGFNELHYNRYKVEKAAAARREKSITACN